MIGPLKRGEAIISEPVSSDEEIAFKDQRECTRCDGIQHLLGSAQGMGKYRCDTCELTICFDVKSDPAEFISYRGLPQRYTKDIYGIRLTTEERRLP